MAKSEKQKLEVKNINEYLSQSGWLDSETEGQLLLDVFADQKNIYIKSAIAGVKPQDLEISLNNDMLTIRGTRQAQAVADDDIDYFYQECHWGSFSRSIILPVEVKTDEISAVLKNGVLTITLPKTIRRTNIPIQIKQD